MKRREIARPLDYTHRGVASGFLPGPTGKSRSSAPVQMLRDSGVAEAVQTRAGTPGLGHGHGIRNTLLPVGMPGTTSGAKRLPVTPTARSGKGRGNLAFFSRAKETWRCGRPGYRPGRGRRGGRGGSLHQLRGDAGAKASALRRRPQGRKPTGRLGAPRAGNRVEGQRPRGDFPHLSGRSHRRLRAGSRGLGKLLVHSNLQFMGRCAGLEGCG